MTPLLCAFALLASDAWILFRGEQRVTMSASMANLRSAQQLIRKFGPEFLWFQRGGKQYVVRDGKVLKQASQVAEDDEAANAREAEADAQEAVLGRYEQKIEKHRDQIEELNDQGVRSDDLKKAQADLAKAQKQLAREQAKLGREQQTLSKAEAKRAKVMEQKMAALMAAALRDGTAQEAR